MAESANWSIPPGLRLREAHAHLPMLGDALCQPDLSACASVDECLHRVKDQAGRVGPGGWALFRGARIEGWSDPRWPTLAELDAASPSNPVMILSFDHHMGVANGRALASAGMVGGQRVEPNGLVVADSRGNPTGLLLEQAAYAVWHSAPEPHAPERMRRLQAALEHLARFGYHEVHDLNAPAGLGADLAALDRALPAGLPLSVRLYCAVWRIESEVNDARTYASPRVRLAGGKLFADGTLNGRTALTLTPYTGGGHGTAMHTFDQVCQAVACCDRLGLHLAVHAIGDWAVRMTLDAVQRVRPSTPGTRIEHCELIHPDDIPRFAALGVACSPQPCHLLTDIEVLQRALPDALDRVLPLRDLLATGLQPGNPESGLVFGSDAPIVGANPADSIRAAVLRGRGDGITINPGQAIDVQAAWRCFAM